MFLGRMGTVAATAAMALCVGCSSETASTTTIQIDGSSTVYPVTEAVAEEFQKTTQSIRVTAGFSGTGGGFKKFIDGSIEICGASRPIKDSEKEKCEAAGVEYIQLEVAFDGLAVVLNPENDWCDSLTVEQLKEIWRPESGVKKWSDINPEWPEEEIHLYGPGTDSGTFDYFTKAINGEEGASRADYTASEDDNVLVTGVQEDKFAMGYFGFAYYIENKGRLKLMGVDGGDGPMTPSEETVRDGTYQPLSRPIFIYVRKDALKDREDVQQFVRFYLDNCGDLASEVGYVAISDDAAKKNEEAYSSATSG